MVTPGRWALRGAEVCIDGEQVRADLLVIDGVIAGIGTIDPPAGTAEVDLDNRIIAAGLVDIQLNGLMGSEVYQASASALNEMSLAAPRFGCTAFLPTMISASEALYRQLFQNMPHVRPLGGAKLLGIHMEGPYINPAFAGAHSLDAIRKPDLSEARRLLDAADGAIRIWTVAPEMEGGCDLVQLLRAHGVVVAAGHSNLSFEEATACFSQGVQLVTHLFNAMCPLHHRSPGLPGAALSDPRVGFSIIADGTHVHPAVLRLAYRLAPDRLLLITDAAAPTGGEDGTYVVSGREVIYENGLPRLPDGRLAGSGLTALQAVRNLCEFADCTLADAVLTMTARPAALLGCDMEVGRIAEGMPADLIILRESGELEETWIDGLPVYKAGQRGLGAERIALGR